ncbi:MAG: hypothetical protein L3J30_07195 [Marinosulfonomonas sp.]|nr:hypothetical protein [Marinosulfonomonas sp.]
MISQLTGAIVRAMLIMVLVATPSLLLPGVNPDTVQIVSLIALFGALLTFIEYSSSYPSLVEFRDAPPFNRVRFMSLFATVFLLSAIFRGQTDPTTLTQFIEATGSLVGQAIDFPFSPVRLVVLMLPENASVENLAFVRTAAGISYLISLLTLATFVILLRLQRWPSHDKPFNVWVNLPTFDPTTGGDVVEKLNRDARFNIVLGFLLPFLMPVAIKAASNVFDPITLDSPQTMVWTMAAWAFLPSSLFMRGIAMGRIASMVAQKRKQSSALAELNGLQPA